MDKILAENVLFKKIEQSDNALVRELILNVMSEFHCVGEGSSSQDPELNNMFESYDNPHSIFIVLKYENNILGCGGFAPLKGGNENVCELRKMYFYKDLRGLGLGQKFLSHLIDEAKSRGYVRMYLETVERMEKANVLYKRNGFAKQNAVLGNTGHSACDSYYVKEL